MRQEELGTMSIRRLLPSMALPLIIAQIVNGMYNLVDRVFLGHIAEGGAEILTGVGLAYPVILIISAFSSLIGNGGAPRAATFLGQGRKEKAEEILSTSALSLLILSVVLMAFFYAFKRPLLFLFGASERTIIHGDDYLSIYLAGTPFVLITLGLNPFISMQGRTTMSMMTVIIGAALNIILDPILIFTFSMGAKGAALATVISQGASALYVLWFLAGRRSSLSLRLRGARLKAATLRPVISLGLSPFTMGITEATMSFVFTSRLQAISGDLAVGAMTILSSVMQFTMLPLQGLGQGAQPILSYNFGAGNKERVKGAYFLLLRVNLIYSFILWALVMLFPSFFVRMFTSDEALASFSAGALRVYMAVSVLMGIQMACQMTFTSLGNARSSSLVAIMRKFILLIPLMYLLPHIFTGNQTMAVFLAEPVADTLSVIFSATLFFFEFRKALKRL